MARIVDQSAYPGSGRRIAAIAARIAASSLSKRYLRVPGPRVLPGLLYQVLGRWLRSALPNRNGEYDAPVRWPRCLNDRRPRRHRCREAPTGALSPNERSAGVRVDQISRIAERKLFSLRALLREDSTRYEQIADREAKTNCELL